MSELYDGEWRATRDLVIPTHPGEPHIGVSVPAGEVIPEQLRELLAAEPAAAAPRRRARAKE
ncbi:hypothetical protein [Pseudonocardia sp. MH-G8]|uniref:hypothetical protein n=1 Tax=Pseudonocardia sp. MH-G8 TaxID=1854588 RepID=UPI000BA076D1|nr:hypothetical protein [Pseudonocardia sp. MH-G8]OZM84094.1 hypothetical protein CFP66_06715 [Pseudonocardia sp. MH-G8]